MHYVLAPLAEFTNAAFRRLCFRHGADLAYTEMVSAAGLAHGSSPTRHLLEVLPGEGPVVCQLFGGNPDELAAAARAVSALGRFAAIDLNAGCPMPKIMQGGAGAALIRDPARVHACLAAIRAETALPVTLKTRPGPRPDAVALWELLDAAETAGCAGLALHGRFTSQLHGGPVHYDLLAELVQRAKIPVTGNGGVYDRRSLNLLAQTGVAAVMIGRAALANPWLFEDLKKPVDPHYDTLRPARQAAFFQEHLDNLRELHAQLARAFPDDPVPSLDGYVSLALHKHLFRYFNGRPGAAQLRRRLNEIRTLREVMDTAASFFAAP